jgi:hypothetical protein
MTACLPAILTVIVIAQQPTLPRHHPLSDEYRREWEQAYRNWTPGPNARPGEQVGVVEDAQQRGSIRREFANL